MKIAAIVIALSTVAAVAGIAWSAEAPAMKLGAEHVSRIKGTDAYFEVRENEAAIGPIECMLRGKPDCVLVCGITFTFRKGMESRDPVALVNERQTELLNAMIMFLSDLSPANIDKPSDFFRLKRQMRGIIERTAFPKGEARVERIYFGPFMLRDAHAG